MTQIEDAEAELRGSARETRGTCAADAGTCKAATLASNTKGGAGPGGVRTPESGLY